MSAEVLRQAAALMRNQAEAATPGPWELDSNNCCVGSTPNRDGGDDYWVAVRPGATPSSSIHIASWHPAVALMVADLLDAIAADREADPYLPKLFDEPSLTLARAYLGESS